MSRKTQWLCDGCDKAALSDLGRAPDGWHEVSVKWSGLGGYPSNLPDEEVLSDLCPACAREYSRQIRPRTWPRCVPVKDKAEP